MTVRDRINLFLIWLKVNLAAILFGVLICLLVGFIAFLLFTLDANLRASDGILTLISVTRRELQACEQTLETVKAQQALPEDRLFNWVDLGILEVYFDDDCILPDNFAAYSDHAVLVVCTEDEELKQKLLDVEEWMRDNWDGWRIYLPIGGQLLWFPVLRKRG